MNDSSVVVLTSHSATSPDQKMIDLKKMLDSCGMDYPKELTRYFCENYKISLAELKDMDVSELKRGKVSSQLKENEYSFNAKEKSDGTLVSIEIDLKKIPANDDKMLIEVHLV